MGQKVYARQVLGIGKEFREPGEVFELPGGRNDELLIKHRYVIAVPRFTKIDTLPKCDVTDRVFIDEGFLIRHRASPFHPLSPTYDPSARTEGPKPPPVVKTLWAGPVESGAPQIVRD